ncbi:MAG TPA: MarR family transcriptional regulator [Pseudomonadales bacterium]|nr:MarR family transcriptional regulator [Pseudomonadales bacterium]
MAFETATVRERFGFTLGRLGRIWRQQLDARLLARGVSYSRWVVLAYLTRLGEGINQKDLAGYMGIEAPTLVRLLDGLEAEGLVERRPHPADRRAKAVHLTANAAPELAQFNEVAREVRATLLDGISEADLETCLMVLDRIDRNAAGIETALPAAGAQVAAS